MFIRPSPPLEYTDAHYNQMASEINNNSLIAGNNIYIKRGSAGTEIGVANSDNTVKLVWKGIYNFSSSYEVNDVVLVDPNITYTNESGSVIPYTATGSYTKPLISAGVFVCTRFVPAVGQDSLFLLNYVSASYKATGQAITRDLADTFRQYTYNVYYPIYPLIPTSSEVLVSQSSWTVTANLNFWDAISPMMPIDVCINNITKTLYVNGILSGSTFNSASLPYH